MIPRLPSQRRVTTWPWASFILLVAVSFAVGHDALQAGTPLQGSKVVGKFKRNSSTRSCRVNGDDLVKAAIREAANSGRALNKVIRGSNPIELRHLLPGRPPVRVVRLFQGIKFRASDIDTVIDDSSH